MSQGTYGTGVYGSGVYPSFTGASTTSGVLHKRVTRALAGTSTGTTGTVARSRLTFRSLAGLSTTTTGTLTRRDARALSGTSTGTTGALTRRTARALAGASTTSGTVTKRITRGAFTGTSTGTTATVSTSRVSVRALAGTSTGTTGALTKRTGRALVGTSTGTTGAFTHGAPNHPVAGASTTSGTLTKRVTRALAGTSATSGALTPLRVSLSIRSFAGASTTGGVLSTLKHTLVHLSIGGASTTAGALTPVKRGIRFLTIGGTSGGSGDLERTYWIGALPVPYVRRYRGEITLSSLTDRTPWQIAEQLSAGLGCDFTVYAGRVATWRERVCPDPPDYRCRLEDLASYEPDELDVFTRLIATYTDPHTRERGRTEMFVDHGAENRLGVQLLAVKDAGSVTRSYANAWAQQQLATGAIPTVRATLGPVATVSDWYEVPVDGAYVRATQWVHIETKAPLMIMSTSLDGQGNVTLQLGERQLTPAADQARLRREVNQMIRQTSANTGGPA